jgi:ParB family chromosome partitioning protein
MLREVAGKKVADGNIAEKVKTQKAIVRDCLTGSNDRRKVEGWVPRWLRFPAASYTARPFPSLAKWKQVEPHIKGLPAPLPVEIDPVDPYAVAAE